MADFLIAFTKTSKDEGEWVNDPDDLGGETYCGIAREYHPNWEGWDVIDQLKQKNNFPDNLKSNDKLKYFVRKFLKENFWDTWHGDKFSSQLIADEIYDQAINLGIKFAIRGLQITLTIYNRGYSPKTQLYEDLVVDGVAGEKTIKALEIFCKNDVPFKIYKALNDRQSYGYQERAYLSPKKRKYINGWMNRTKEGNENET